MLFVARLGERSYPVHLTKQLSRYYGLASIIPQDGRWKSGRGYRLGIPADPCIHCLLGDGSVCDPNRDSKGPGTVILVLGMQNPKLPVQ